MNKPTADSTNEVPHRETLEEFVSEIGHSILKSNLTLYTHQADLLSINPERYLIAHEVGTGKTITGIALANKNCSKTGSCLIIVPKILKEKWERDIQSHGNENINWNILTKETFKKVWKELPAYDAVIVDEAHYFAGIKSQLSKSLYSYFKRHDTRFRWLMTGTPYLSSPLNIYTLARHLGHEWNYRAFVQKFFWEINIGGRIIPKIKDNMEPHIAELVNLIGGVVSMQNVIYEIPEQTFKTEYFNLTPEQEKAWNDLDEAVFITKWTKRHQIENGFLYGDEYTDTKTLPCLKDERILELVRTNRKVAIFCRYIEQQEHIKKLIAYTKKPIFILNGETENRDLIISEAETSEECVIIIQAQCSVGYELPSFPVIIFASLSFSLVDHEQALGRFQRINKLKKNTYIYLVSEGVDKDIYECIMRKQDFSFAIYGKIK